MPTYVVALESRTPGVRYTACQTLLNSYGSRKAINGVHVVTFDGSAAELRDQLLPTIRAGDGLFVCALVGPPAFHPYRLDLPAQNWVRSHLRRRS